MRVLVSKRSVLYALLLRFNFSEIFEVAFFVAFLLLYYYWYADTVVVLEMNLAVEPPVMDLLFLVTWDTATTLLEEQKPVALPTMSALGINLQTIITAALVS